MNGWVDGCCCATQLVHTHLGSSRESKRSQSYLSRWLGRPSRALFGPGSLNVRNESPDMHGITEMWYLHPSDEKRQLVPNDACSSFAVGKVRMLVWI